MEFEEKILTYLVDNYRKSKKDLKKLIRFIILNPWLYFLMDIILTCPDLK
jgi:hypothetical protein